MKNLLKGLLFLQAITEVVHYNNLPGITTDSSAHVGHDQRETPFAHENNSTLNKYCLMI